MQEEIVSLHWRIQKTRTPKTTEKLGFLLLNLWDSEGFFSQTPITMVQFQMSHIFQHVQEALQRDEIPLSGHQTLQNLVSLKGRPLSIVNESKLNHKGPLYSGQIFQLAVKSYLRFTKDAMGENDTWWQ